MSTPLGSILVAWASTKAWSIPVWFAAELLAPTKCDQEPSDHQEPSVPWHHFLDNQYFSGTKKEPKPKLLSPDIFRWGRGLPREGVGAKKFGMPLETREINLFWRDIPGFRRDIPGVPEKFEKKSLGSIFVPQFQLLPRHHTFYFSFVWSDSGQMLPGPKRHPNTKISPSLNPPFRGLQALKVFVFGLFLSLRCRKSANTKNFEGGRGGQETNLCVGFLWVFFIRSLMLPGKI